MTINKLLDGTFGKYHLWFLLALFVAGVLLYYFSFTNLSPKELFFIGTLIYLISMLEILTVNQLFSYGGFPKGFFYLAMGFYIGKQKVEFKPAITYSLSFFVLYAVLSMIISTSMIHLVMAPGIFFLLVFINTHPGKESLFSKVGAYSLQIYILHVFVIESYELLITYFPTFEPSNDVVKIVVLTLASVLVPLAIYKPVGKILVKPINGIIDRIINIEKYGETN